ncbi:hypothetical protein BZL29_7802 [Mycobacterium kansasii]|uniref:Uncharacterized protein n=1 Tax=Mycobacterium kansasii TaxID=1768 RepID=A0A1V3WEM9_MYCKA|nr:hypothetical protein BZL29_7802 [Mycobacterium kansasii]
MAQPTRRTHAAVRSYCDQLRELMDQLRADPLNEAKSVALVAHVINNRSTALQLFEVLENQAMGSPC